MALAAQDYTFKEFSIPGYIVSILQAYVATGRPTGGFLKAVLSNNFTEAFAHADDHNLRNMPAYAAYLYNEMPSGCYGSPLLVQQWIEHRGLEGLHNETDTTS